MNRRNRYNYLVLFKAFDEELEDEAVDVGE